MSIARAQRYSQLAMALTAARVIPSVVVVSV